MKLEPERILVFRTGHLGDTIVSLPAFWSVRRAFPRAEIALLSNADPYNPHYVAASNVLPQHGLFDRTVAYPNFTNPARAALAYAALAAKLRLARFDTLVYLMTRERTAGQIDRDTRFFRFAGVKEILCTQYAKSHNLPVEIPVPAPQIQSENSYLKECLRSEGIEPAAVADPLGLTGEERAAASAFFRDAGIDPGRQPLIAVGPGSKWTSKIWPEDRYAVVVDRLISEFGVVPAVFGGPEDAAKARRLIDRWGAGVNAAGVLSVREAAAALEHCRLYLGNDTGTMHLAAAVGVPCTAVFAAIDWPGRWYPSGEGHTVFRERVECEGCLTPDCFNANKCLDLVEADAVYRACVRTLGSTPSRGPEEPARSSSRTTL